MAKKKDSEEDNQQNPTRIKKAAMLKALEKSLGVVTNAANEIGIDRCTHYEWLKTDKEYKTLQRAHYINKSKKEIHYLQCSF